MPLVNIIDRRKRHYRFKKVNAVIEPTRHDNQCKDADRARLNPWMDKKWIGYGEKEHVSVLEAIVFAAAHQDDVTLYLYDKDGGIYEKRASRKGSGGGVLALRSQSSRPGRRSKKSARHA